MAVGDLVVADYQYEYRGLLLGSGTSYQTESVEGILGLPDVRANDEAKGEDHGDNIGVDLLPGRTITMVINTLATPTTHQPLVDALCAAFQTSKRNAFVEWPFVTQRPGHTKRYCNVRTRRSSIPSNYDTAHGLPKAAVQLYATDPRFYSLVESQQLVAIGNNATQGQADAVAGGDFIDGVWPIIEVPGPVTNPRITNLADGGRTIRIDVAIAGGQTLIIDTALKTVTLAGVDRYDTVRADNQWWQILPGVNTISAVRSVGTAAVNIKVRWHDGWTGA